MKIIGFVFLSLFVCGALCAQTKEIEEMWRRQMDTGWIDYIKPWYPQIDEDGILKLLDNQPGFGMYKDNYIISGVPTNKAITQYTADAKFQVSIYHRLT